MSSSRGTSSISSCSAPTGRRHTGIPSQQACIKDPTVASSGSLGLHECNAEETMTDHCDPYPGPSVMWPLRTSVTPVARERAARTIVTEHGSSGPVTSVKSWQLWYVSETSGKLTAHHLFACSPFHAWVMARALCVSDFDTCRSLHKCSSSDRMQEIALRRQARPPHGFLAA